MREVSSIPSWVYCFLTVDTRTRDCLAYAILVLREAMHHGGTGWLEYDRLFRQQAALDPTLSWSVIHPGLQASTILAQRSARCTLCADCDHVATQCALAQLQQPTVGIQQPTTSRSSQQPWGGTTTGRTPGRICNSWNEFEGACTYPGSCTFRHVCSNCFQASHRLKDCRLPPKPRALPPSRTTPSTTSATPL